MQRTWRTSLLWPGLAELWFVGSWFALALALLTAATTGAVLLITFGWSELVSQQARITLWAALGAFWVVGVGWSLKRWRKSPESSESLYLTALDHYLRGDYYQAERVLRELLRRNSRDIEARLMLATLFRRSGRWDDASRELDLLSRYEDAQKWRSEIEGERKLLKQKRTPKVAA